MVRPEMEVLPIKRNGHRRIPDRSFAPASVTQAACRPPPQNIQHDPARRQKPGQKLHAEPSLVNPGIHVIIGQMPARTVQGMLDFAKRLAAEVSPIALSGFGETTVAYKADDSVVTEADLAIQDHILTGIARAYPDHAVCAEETQSESHTFPERTDARYCWAIDPIDGTRNYASGLPCFSTSLALLDAGRPVVGVVLEHNLGLLYAAAQGSGTTCNDAPIHVEEVPEGSDMLVGFPSSKDQLTVDVLRDWVPRPGLIGRTLGSTALQLALVASGALTATFSKRSKIWDIAAGVLLVSEAGGCSTDISGANRMSFDLTVDPNEDLPCLAAAPKAHERLLASIRTALQ